MSNAGQAILTIGGTILGAYFGYPQLGFVLGSLAGQALFPTQLPGVTGPKLTDRNTTSAQVGDPVVWIFGTDYSTGTVIWLDEIETVEQTEHQGKGGPSQDFTTFTYFQSIAVGICGTYPTEAYGPGTKELLRVWENGKVVYDVRPQRSGESDSDYAARLASSAEYAATFVFYNGAADQLPDPTIEAVRGVGNTPAFRDLCYIVYPRRQLQDTQAQRHPSFRFEVGSCTADFAATRHYTSPGTHAWVKPYGLVSATVTCIGGGEGGSAGGSDRPEGVGLTNGGGGGGGGGAGRDTFDASELPDVVEIVVGHGGQGAAQNTEPLSIGVNGDPGGDSSFGALVRGRGGGTVTPGIGGLGSPQIAAGGAGTNPGGNTSGDPVGLGPGRPAGAGGGTGGGANQFTGLDGSDGGDGEADPDGPPAGAGGGLGGTAGDIGPPEILAGPGFIGNDSLIHHGGGGGGGGGGARGGDGGTGGRGGKYGGGGGGGGGGTLGVDFPIGGPGGDGAPGIVSVEQDFGANDPCEATQSIGLIVAAICERCGLTAIETSTINDTLIHGYALARHLNGRAAIDPLRSVGWFDVVESGLALKFVKRGADPVAQLETADLGAHEFGGTIGPAITSKKAQDPELPKVVRVHYFAVSRDYEYGEAVSPWRTTTDATNPVDVELPIALDDQTAAEIVEAIWADSWTARDTHEASVGRNWIQLEPTDPVLIPLDGEYQRMRVVTIQDSSLLLRKLTLVRDDDDNFVPIAVAVEPQRPPSVIDVKAPTLLIVLDLPPLRFEDDDPGVYAAVAPATGSTWQGAVIYRSCDGELTWEPLTDGLTETLVGELVDALEDTAFVEGFDMGSTLRVEIPVWAATTPASATIDQLANGANACAIGAPGRWEIVQYQFATQVSATVWELTGLLRGRRSTNHNIGTSVAGDRFVLLDENTITRLAVDPALIDETCSYRPVTFATTFASGADQDIEHEHEGQALIPFSPVDVTAARDMSGDIGVLWDRRDRLGFTLSGTLPMSEAVEAYQVDVVYLGNVIRTLSSGTESATYSAAQQATDGTAAATALFFRVYQISAVMGRGWPGECQLAA